MRVVKRDGSYVPWDDAIIKRTIFAASAAAGEDTSPWVDDIAVDVYSAFNNHDSVMIHEIQDELERVIIRYELPNVARRLITYRAARDDARTQAAVPDVSVISDYIHAAKYARVTGTGHLESWAETVDRTSYFLGLSPEISQQLYRREVLPSMRLLQFAGKAIVANNARLYNCSGTLLNSVRKFQEIFWMLLSGTGVGVSLQFVDSLPIPQSSKRVLHWHIDDTIEGWSDALGVLLDGFFSGAYYTEFDYSLVRSEGSKLKTTGGLAPGHIPLRNMLEQVRAFLIDRAGRRLRAIDCFDLLGFIGQAVLSGGIRRTAMIILFDPTDTEMLYSKAPGNFDPFGGINKQREVANISACFTPSYSFSEFEKVIQISTEGYGEPGYYYTPDPRIICNPCGEVRLDLRSVDWAVCNLSEINGSIVTSESHFISLCKSAATIATLQTKHNNLFYLQGTCYTDDLGVSITGVMDNPSVMLSSEILRAGSAAVISQNNALGGKAVRFTCVKPSGTASLLLGCIGSGVHRHHSRKYFRRIMSHMNEKVGAYFAEANPHMAQLIGNHRYLTFPVQAPDGALTLTNCSAEQQLSEVALLAGNWCVGGAVSSTIVADPGEVKVGELWDRRELLSGLTFVPRAVDKMYPNAPREAVMTKEDMLRWSNLVTLCRPVDYSELRVDSRVIGGACDGPTCDL